MSEQRLIDANALCEALSEYRLSKTVSHFLSSRECEGFRDGVEASIELVKSAPTVEAAPVVLCGECIWWQDRQVQLADGGCRDYMPDEPWSVTSDIGINVGAHCTKHGFEDKSGSWFWANANDFCSRGERREGKP